MPQHPAAPCASGFTPNIPAGHLCVPAPGAHEWHPHTLTQSTAASPGCHTYNFHQTETTGPQPLVFSSAGCLLLLHSLGIVLNILIILTP